MADERERHMSEYKPKKGGRPLDTTHCRYRVYSDWSSHQCTSKHKPGSKWCGTHDPVAIKAKQDTRDEKYRLERNALNNKHKRENLFRAIAEASIAASGTLPTSVQQAIDE